MIIFSERGYEQFINNADVQERLNFRRADTVEIMRSQDVGEGGIRRGTIDIGDLHVCYVHS